ncbi:hypothetical protein [Pseudooceanicola sp. LIPI14-2-Ac024]|uniref:hypothetical protein n=1 Tax=Pseudooceanicola sp. LIPI14-2-Ac024 TaxID=3344875 RepID=UPI0035D10578
MQRRDDTQRVDGHRGWRHRGHSADWHGRATGRQAQDLVTQAQAAGIAITAFALGYAAARLAQGADPADLFPSAPATPGGGGEVVPTEPDVVTDTATGATDADTGPEVATADEGDEGDGASTSVTVSAYTGSVFYAQFGLSSGQAALTLLSYNVAGYAYSAGTTLDLTA